VVVVGGRGASAGQVQPSLLTLQPRAAVEGPPLPPPVLLAGPLASAERGESRTNDTSPCTVCTCFLGDGITARDHPTYTTLD
ncbi:MAG: hypothetical protein MZV70_22690, partial [Desulfobacterales bacterium]|nr:hypothetical protein [Desulfobacterales bacterium]